MLNDELRQALFAILDLVAITLHLLVPTPSDDFVSLSFLAIVNLFSSTLSNINPELLHGQQTS